MLILPDALPLQEAAAVYFHAGAEQLGIDIGVFNIEVDAVGAGDARRLVFHLGANVNLDARMRVTIPRANPCHLRLGAGCWVVSDECFRPRSKRSRRWWSGGNRSISREGFIDPV